MLFLIFMFVKPALCFLLLGTFFSYFGFEAIRFLKTIPKKGIEWTGNIVEFQSDSDGHKTPLIEFTTMSGDLVREPPFVYASSELSKIRTYDNLINQSVPILYDPDDPKKFVLKTEAGFSYFVFTFFLLAGLFFIGLSISSLLGYIKIR